MQLWQQNDDGPAAPGSCMEGEDGKSIGSKALNTPTVMVRTKDTCWCLSRDCIKEITFTSAGRGICVPEEVHRSGQGPKKIRVDKQLVAHLEGEQAAGYSFRRPEMSSQTTKHAAFLR
eukprot:1151484-Pelagomonas_calceolata.AAC.5